jgi:hypothetical protein
MTNTLVIARRKSGKVRYFNTRTARMSKWVRPLDSSDPAVKAGMVQSAGRRNGKAAARQADYEAMRESMSRLPVIHVQSTLEAYTVAQIRTAGQKVLGMSFPSKMRKADMIAAYLAEQTARLA